MIQLENTPRKAIGIWTPSGILQPGGSARRGTISNSPRVSSRHLRAFNRRIFFFFKGGKQQPWGTFIRAYGKIYIYIHVDMALSAVGVVNVGAKKQ